MGGSVPRCRSSWPWTLHLPVWAFGVLGAHPQLACVLFSLFGHAVQLQIHRFEDAFCSLCLPTHLHVDWRRQPLFCKFNWKNMKRFWFAQTILLQGITSLGKFCSCPVADTCVGFWKESMAFDLKVKGDFATVSDLALEGVAWESMGGSCLQKDKAGLAPVQSPPWQGLWGCCHQSFLVRWRLECSFKARVHLLFFFC